MKKLARYIIFLITLVIGNLALCNNTILAEENIKNEQFGYQYSTTRTIFRLYSSEANEVKVVVEDVENGTANLSKTDNSNVWIGYVGGDLKNKEYSYYIKLNNGLEYYNVIDPYGKFLNSSRTRNVICEETIFDNSTASETEEVEERNFLKISEKSRIIYGINVSNFTSHSTWNGTSENKGKLLGLVESGTTYSGVSTGYDYVSNLGVTYIELSEIYDYLLPYAINKEFITGIEIYSGQKELKEVSDKYYNKGIGIVLPFDYKLLNDYFTANILKISKSDYLDENNEIDLEKNATKAYIINLLKYYVEKYFVAGIKIENMSDYSVEFINELVTELNSINPNIYVYGDGSYSIENSDNAGQNNLSNLNNVSMLNGSLSYGLFGNLFNNTEQGILDGNFSEEIIETLKFTLLSTVKNENLDYSKVLGVSYKNYWGNSSSYEIINYFGQRSGLSIYDKLFVKNFTSDNVIKEKIILSFSYLMISGGTPYIYSGEEFLSSYIDNYYSNSTSVCNSSGSSFCFYTEESKKIIDWSYAKTNQSVVDSLKSYINFKKSNTEMMLTDAKSIENNVSLVAYDNTTGVVGYKRDFPNAYTKHTQKIFVVFNFSNNDYELNEINEKGIQGLYNYNLSNRDGDIIKLSANSFYSEKKIKQPKVNNWVSLIVALGLIGGVYFLNIILNKKLVEEKGYDIKNIKKKYRPFIKTNNTETNNQSEENINDKEN